MTLGLADVRHEEWLGVGVLLSAGLSAVIVALASTRPGSLPGSGGAGSWV